MLPTRVRVAVLFVGLYGFAACGRTPLGLASEVGDAPDASRPLDAAASVDAAERDQATATNERDGAMEATPEDAFSEPTDAAPDAVAAAACEEERAAYVACGCGCCGGTDPYAVCYYPARGETLQAIVTSEPTPTPEECSWVGCTEGVAYLCCAASAELPLNQQYCGDYLLTALDRIYIRMTTGATCVSLTLVSPARASNWPVELPPSWGIESAQRYPCDASQFPEHAIGAIGAIRESPSLVFKLDVTLFFDAGTGVAEPVRLDVGDLIPRGCPP